MKWINYYSRNGISLHFDEQKMLLFCFSVSLSPSLTLDSKQKSEEEKSLWNNFLAKPKTATACYVEQNDNEQQFNENVTPHFKRIVMCWWYNNRLLALSAHCSAGFVAGCRKSDRKWTRHTKTNERMGERERAKQHTHTHDSILHNNELYCEFALKLPRKKSREKNQQKPFIFAA